MRKVIILICGVLLMSCTKLDDEMAWDNIFDQDSDTFKRPVVIPMNDTIVSIKDSVVMHVDVQTGNGRIEQYCWSFDGGGNWTDGNDNGTYIRYFSESDTGLHRVWVKVIDSLGLESKTDSFYLEVKEFPPGVTPVNDTIVSVTDSVALTVFAADSNNTRGIMKYYWDMGADGWDDSTDEACYVIKHSQGGTLPVIWGARDDDDLFAADTFSITFNRPPVSLAMVDPGDNDTASFIEYNKVTGKGKIRVHFTATDPDGEDDTLTYTLLAGDDPGNLVEQYTGKETATEIRKVPPSKTFYWKLQVSDLFGDTAEKTGTFISASVDLTPPVLTLKGDNPLNISLGVKFTDPGATAIDNVDGDISDSIKVSGDVNTKQAGTYEITYTVEDAMENQASIKRTVIVESYILLEDFETGPAYQSAFGEIFGNGQNDSVGYWRAWTDTISTEWDPDPDSSDSAFEFIVAPGNGVDGSGGFHAMPRVYDPHLPDIFWGVSFYIKKSDATYDIFEMDSITFYAKTGGSGETVNLRFDVQYPGIEWGYAGAGIELTENWEKYVLTPGDFEGVPDSPGAGHTWSSAGGTVKMLRFISDPLNYLGDVDLYLDNIQLHGPFSNSELLEH